MAVSLLKVADNLAIKTAEIASKLDGGVKILSVDLLKDILNLENLYKDIQATKACEPPKPPKEPKPKVKKSTGKKTVQARKPRQYQAKDLKRITEKIQSYQPCGDTDMLVAAAVLSCVGGLTWVDLLIEICTGFHEIIGLVYEVTDVTATITSLEDGITDVDTFSAQIVQKLEDVSAAYDQIFILIGSTPGLDTIQGIINYLYNNDVLLPFKGVLAAAEAVVSFPRQVCDLILMPIDGFLVWFIAFLQEFKLYLLAFAEL